MEALPSNLSPPAPPPPAPNPKDRIKALEGLLSEDYLQCQRVNILRLIELYKSGELKPPAGYDRIYLCDGKVLDAMPTKPEDIPKGSAVFVEVSYYYQWSIHIDCLLVILGACYTNATTTLSLGVTFGVVMRCTTKVCER